MAEIEVRDRILSAARLFFTRYGFKKTTMDEIAKHIHKAKGVLYYYFKSKEDVFNEALRNELNEIKSQLNVILRKDISAIDKIYEYFTVRDELLSTAEIYHETLKADLTEAYSFVQEVQQDFRDFSRKSYKSLLTEGVESKVFTLKNIDSTIDILMLLEESLEVPLFVKGEYHKHKESIRELMDIVVEAFKVKTSKS